MKRFIAGVLVLLIFVLAGLLLVRVITQADVQERDVNRKEYKFNLSPGDRIVVIKSGYDKVYVRVSPISFKDFDYKVTDGKTLKGVLILK